MRAKHARHFPASLHCDLYSTSVDDLFDRDKELDSESINAAYQNALTLLGEDYDAGIAYVRQQVRDHWACAELLRMMDAALFAQIPRLSGFGDTIEGESLRCFEGAERITRRATELSSKEAASLTELPMLVRIFLRTGREREAERLIEDHMPKAPNLQAGLLVQLYRETGRPEEAIAIPQRALLVSLLEAQATISSMAPMADNDRLGDLENPEKPFSQMKPSFQHSRRSCRQFACKRRRIMPAKVLLKTLYARLILLQTRSTTHALLCPAPPILASLTRCKTCFGLKLMRRSTVRELRPLRNCVRRTWPL